MRLQSVRIQNFRSFKDETVTFDSYTCLVGANGAGKSCILAALNVFFRNSNSAPTNVLHLTEEDFHHKNTDDPIRITLTFCDLSPEARMRLKHYVRHDLLIVSSIATWNPDQQRAEVRQCGQRLIMEDFKAFFEQKEAGLSAAELAATYKGIQSKYADLPNATSTPKREEALREYEEGHPDKCILEESKADFYGWSRGENRLREFVQWVYVPAVKEVSAEQEEGSKTALGQLLERRVRSKVEFDAEIATIRQRAAHDYQKLVDGKKAALGELETCLRERLREWSNPGVDVELTWHYDSEKTIFIDKPWAKAFIGEDRFLGEIARLGHGVQRSFLLALLQEEAADSNALAPTLILGFEEPELYQHPPQAMHIARVLEELATKAGGNSQVIVSTHSPYFVSSKGFENVRRVRKSPVEHCSLVSATTYEEISTEVASALGETPATPSTMLAAVEQIMQPSLRELYFCRFAILVEGQEDVAFVSTQLHLSKLWESFRRHGCHFIVCGGKTNLSRPLVIAQKLCIEQFVIFDGDNVRVPNDQKARNERDNRCLLKLTDLTSADPNSRTVIWGERVVMWGSTILDAVLEEIGQDAWDKAEEEAREQMGFRKGVHQKNPLLVAATLESLRSHGVTCKTLLRLCSQILARAAGTTGRESETPVSLTSATDETPEIVTDVPSQKSNRASRPAKPKRVKSQS